MDTKTEGEIGDSRYEENVVAEVRDMAAETFVIGNSLGTNKFDHEFLLSLEAELLSLLERDEIDTNEVIQFAIRIGPVARRLELSSMPGTIETLRHTLMIVMYAKDCLQEGHEVWLIESCDRKGIQLLPDLDLMVFDEQRVAIDMTHKPGLAEGEWIIHPREKKLKKYEKLDSIMEAERVAVVSMGLPAKAYNLKSIKYEIFRDCPREGDFQFTDETVDAFRALTWRQATELADNYTRKVSEMEVISHRDQVKTAGVYSSKEEYEKVKPAISKNNPTSARLYEDFRKSMDESLSKGRNAKNQAENYFSLDYYNKIQSAETRWHIPIPDIVRGITTSDPFQRLKEIDHYNPDPLSWALMQLADIDEVHMSSMPHQHQLKGVYAGYKVARVIKDGVKTNMFRISGDNIERLISNHREISPSTRSVDSLSTLEEMFVDHLQDSLSVGSGSLMADDVDMLIDDVLMDSEVAGDTRKIMRDCFKPLARSKLFSRLCISQEIARAMTTGPRLRQKLKKSAGSFSSKSIVMALQNVSDRRAVVAFNIGPLTFGGLRDVTYILLGDMIRPNDPFSKPCWPSCTSFLSNSPAMLDWNCVSAHKAVSWATLQFEQCLTSTPSMREEIMKDLVMPISLSFLNKNTFSQVADQTRYLFVNGIGHTHGVSALFDKISWYSPKTHLEKLYVLRMLKMSDCLSVYKALQCSSELVVKMKSKLVEQGVLNMTIHAEGWDVAMPDETRAYHSQQHTFNSFYNSRALTIQRYQKVMSESLVVIKQLEAREAYLSVKKSMLPHEGRFCLKERQWSTPELYEDMKAHDYLRSAAQPFSPCPRTNYVAIICSLMKIRHPDDKTILETMKRSFNTKDVHRSLLLSKVMNSRGSVRDSSSTGVVVSRKERPPMADKSGKRKVKIVTQNSKCYLTQLNMLHKYVKGIKPPRAQKLDSSFTTDEFPDEDDVDLGALMNLPDHLSGPLSWATHNFSPCVSKMVHKDQLGAREIAVLNPYSRLMCKYVEDVSRHIRDRSFTRGDKTNLIENPDKEDIVLTAKRRTDATLRSTHHVFYDSADCSTWGPSMQPYFFYQTLAARCDEGVRKVIRNCLTLFSNKVFKIPDALYWHSQEARKESNSVISRACEMIRNMSPETGIYEKQVIFLEESMHQGILGCTSSLMGTDAHNLSDYVLTRTHEEEDLMSETFCTSDDYSRIISWRKDTRGVYDMMKRNLSLHGWIMGQMGIKRNKQKSTLSDTYMEFNSVFFTKMGEMKPDVKSRLSYVDYCHSPDSYDISTRVLTQTGEYLRQDGSLVGACWIMLLNTHLAMIQNQSRSLWKQLGRSIYTIPLELGGVARLDPILNAVGHQCLPIVENYGGFSDIRRAFNCMNDCSPFTASLSVSERNMPSLSRSGVVHLCGKTSQSKRRIREFLLSMDKDMFASAYLNPRTPQLLLTLMACAQREKDSSSPEGSFLKLAVTQTPSEAKLYRISSGLIGVMAGEDRVSRNDIHRLALKFTNWDELNYPSYDSGIDYNLVMKGYEEYKMVMQNISIESITLVPRLGHNRPFRIPFASSAFVSDHLKEFEQTNLPKSMGGEVDIHPWEFLEAKMSYTTFLRKISKRHQVFRMCLREKDVANKAFAELLLVSNYIGGARASLKYSGGVLPKLPADATLNSVLGPLKELTPPRGILTVSLLSPSLGALMRSGRVGKVDITEFLNMLLGDSSHYSNSNSMEALVIDALYKGGWSDRLVVRPAHLSVGFHEDRYKTSNHTTVSTINIVTDEGLAGREIRLCGNDKVWHHYYWGTRSPVLAPADSDTDEYHELNVHEHQYLKVEIRSFAGLLSVTNSAGSVLQVLTKNVSDIKTVRLMCRSPLHYDDTLIQQLRDASAVMMPQTFVEFFKEPIAQDPKPESEAEESDVSAGVDLGSLLGSLMGDFDDFGDESEEAEAETKEQNSEEADDEEVAQIVTKEDEENEDSYMRPLSSQSSIRQPEGVLLSLASVSIRRMTKPEVGRLKRKLPPDIQFGYEITVPSKLSTFNFVDGEETAVTKLFNMCRSLNPVDRLWLEDYLNQSLLADEDVRREVEANNYVSRSRSNSGFEEDEDIEWC